MAHDSNMPAAAMLGAAPDGDAAETAGQGQAGVPSLPGRLWRGVHFDYVPVSEEVLAQTEVRGPPWDLSLIEGLELPDDEEISLGATSLHWEQAQLLVESTRALMRMRAKQRYYVAADMYLYYSPAQARFVATHPLGEKLEFLGPDYFFVADGDPSQPRRTWTVWDEDDRYPDVIAELLSPSTANIDKTTKKDRYARVFRTPEYYLYEPGAETFTAYRLAPGADTYQDVSPDEPGGRVFSEPLGAWLGSWHGVYDGFPGTWLRFFLDRDRPDPVPTNAERAEAERAQRQAAEGRAEAAEERAEAAEERAEAEREQRQAAEAELARLRALLGQH